MPLTRQNLLKAVIDECEKVTERYPGYRKALQATVAQILAYESAHRSKATSIKQQIAEVTNKLGDAITKNTSG